MEAAVGQVAGVTGRQEQVFSALATVRAWQAEVDDPAKPHVVEGAERQRRRLDHHRPLAEVDETDEIGSVGIGREEKRFRIHQLREDDDRVVLNARVNKALARSYQGGAPKSVQKRLGGMHEVEIVIDLLDRFLPRSAILEL